MVDKIEEQVRRAMQDGQFDNLPGKGKPLSLDENPFEDPDWRMANHLLSSNGFSLPWIERGREIDEALVAARARLERSWKQAQLAPHPGWSSQQIQDDWAHAVARFRSDVEEINRQILTYNLEVPLSRFQRRKLNADREIETISQHN